MIRRFARARALRRLENMYPNPRGVQGDQFVRARTGRGLLLAVLVVGTAVGVSIWLGQVREPMTSGRLIDCGNGRWVSVAERCR